ncbi:MAG: TonB-dependent receptor [Pseudomonadota bacterium]
MKNFVLSSAVALALGLGHTVAAQESDEAEGLDEIVVTGSRIQRNTLVTPNPVTVLDSSDIEVSGSVNIGDLLNELPALGTTFGTQNSDRFIGTAGLNLLDLRRLGTARTLVLVNGQRHVPGSIGSAAVDVNSIPVGLIERVEVLTGGASATYGADAVTGVVNFILKDDFNGFQIDAQTGRSQDDLERSSVDMLLGFDFNEGRGNAVFAFEYSTVGALSAADRGIPPYRTVNNLSDGDSVDANGNVINDGIPDEVITANAGLSIITNGGYFSAGGTNYVFDAPNSFRPANPGTNFGSSECGNGCDFLDLQSFVNLSTPQDRYSFATMFDYQLWQGHNLHVEGKYVNSRAKGSGQPHFNFFNLTIPSDNAFIMPDLAQVLTDAGSTGFNLNRFNVDAGLRGQDNERETSRVVVGLNGPINDRFSYEANVVYGRTTSQQLNTFNRINERFFAAADAVIDPATGQTVCRHTLDPTSTNASLGRSLDASIVGACVPVNLFGEGAVSQEAIDYFSTTAVRQAVLDQFVFNAYVTGSIVELPAGELGFAAGVEYREESSEDLPDALDALGLTFGNALQPEAGEFDVKEIFGEISVPILNDKPGANSLSLDLAARFSDYSTIGDTFTWRAGVEYAPIPAVRFRGTYSEAIRAPNIGELFGPQNQTFFAVLDPCSEDRLDLGVNGRATREANCRALGIPVGFDAQDQVTREGLQGGNPGLEAEESESFTLGLVLNPIDGLGIAIDYWDITIDDAIDVAAAQDILNRCVDATTGLDNEFCPLISRDATNNITLIVQTQQNIAGLTASGVDVEASYEFGVGDDTLRLQMIATYLDDLTDFPFQSDPLSGEQDAGGLGDPELAGQFNVSYYRDNLALNWSIRYLDSQLRLDIEDVEVNPDAQTPLSTESTFYHDLHARWDATDNVALSFGIDNVLDEDLPFGLNGTGAGSGVFDNVGRFFYGRISYRME